MKKVHLMIASLMMLSVACPTQYALAQQPQSNKGPLEKVCGYRSTIKTLYCPFIKSKNG